MKYRNLALFSIFLINIILCQEKKENNTINDTETQNETMIHHGNGYRCKERLEEYRKQFSSVNTVRIGDDNYEKYVDTHAYTLVYFHSACEPKCLDFIPAIKFVSDFINRKNGTYIPSVISIDLSDDENNLQNQYRFQLDIFPFAILFNAVRQRFVQFGGYLDAHSLITYVMKESHRDIFFVNETEILEQLLNPQMTYFSVFALNNKYIEQIRQLSYRLSFILFGDCSNQTICEEKFGSQLYKYNDFILVKMSNKTNDYTNEHKILLDKNQKAELIPYNFTTFEELRANISINALPRIHIFTDFSAELMFASFFDTIIYIKGKNETKTDKEISKLLEKSIDLKVSNLKWGSIINPLTSNEDQEKIQVFGIDDTDYFDFGLVIIQGFDKENKENHQIYKMDVNKIQKEKGINDKLISEFVKDYGKGKINPEIKSESIPKYHPKGNLRVVVGKTFNKEIYENNQTSIVLCLLALNLTNLQTIEGQIEEMSDKFEHISDKLIFSFIDVGLNYMPDLPKFDVGYMPYYRYFYKNKSLDFSDFGGNFTNQSEIENWILENYGKEYGEESYKNLSKFLTDINKQIEELKKKRQEEAEKRKNLIDKISNLEPFDEGNFTNSTNGTENTIEQDLNKNNDEEQKQKSLNEEKNKIKKEDEKNNISKQTDL